MSERIAQEQDHDRLIAKGGRSSLPTPGREELIIGRRYDMRNYVRLILPPMLTIP